LRCTARDLQQSDWYWNLISFKEAAEFWCLYCGVLGFDNI
jgi:hypothetical protein